MQAIINWVILCLMMIDSLSQYGIPRKYFMDFIYPALLFPDCSYIMHIYSLRWKHLD